MGKRLLSKDYDIIVQETFAMPDNDLKKYYLNTVEENISDNPDIFIQLKNAIQRELNWYLNQLPRYQVWEIDDSTGERIPVDQEKQPFSLRPFGIDRFINRSFFDQQVSIVEVIEKLKEVDRKINDFKKIALNPKTGRKDISFNGLFRDSDNAKKVKELFETRGYTVNGKWQGLTDEKTELLCAYNVLKNLEFLKPGSKTTPTAKIFYSEFGLPDDYITDRMLRYYPKNQETIKEFENLFSPLLRSNK